MRTEHARTWLSLSPVLGIIGVLFGGAVAFMVARSLDTVTSGPSSGLSLNAYRTVLSDTEFGASLALTGYIAIVSTTLSVALGIGVALLLRRLNRGRGLATTMLQLSLPVPHVIGAVAILSLLGQSGLLSRIATHTGLVDGPASFPALIYDPFAVGIIAQYVWKEVPFVGIVALAILHATGNDLDDAARTLGASAGQRLRHVTLPLLLPGVLSAAVIVFAFTFGAFEVPLLLGRSYPMALPVLAYRRYSDIDLASRPEAMAIGVIMTAIVLVVIVAATFVLQRAIRREPAR